VRFIPCGLATGGANAGARKRRRLSHFNVKLGDVTKRSSAFGHEIVDPQGGAKN
jgi:hypothetical protein